jgi:hypothetical protein
MTDSVPKGDENLGEGRGSWVHIWSRRAILRQSGSTRGVECFPPPFWRISTLINNLPQKGHLIVIAARKSQSQSQCDSCLLLLHYYYCVNDEQRNASGKRLVVAAVAALLLLMVVGKYKVFYGLY